VTTKNVSLLESEWQWAGFGYALPGGAKLNPPGGYLEAYFNPAPTENPQAEQYLGRPLPSPGFIVGHTYRVRAIVKVTGARVRITQGWVSSAPAVDESPDDQVLEHVFTATRTNDWIGIGGVHVRMVDGSPSSIVIKSFELKDLDEAPAKKVERTPMVLMPGVGYLDPWRIVVPMTITYGRSSIKSQAEAPSLSFKWLGDLSISWGDDTQDLTVGAPIEVIFSPSAAASTWDDEWVDTWSDGVAPTYAESRRFVGRISELKPDRSGELLQTTVTVIGKSVDYAHRVVGDKPWPAQTEAERVAAIAAAMGATVENRGGSWRIMARDIDAQPALDLLKDLPGSTGALVYERRDGTLRYDGSAVRKVGIYSGPPVALTAAGWSNPANASILAGSWPDGSGAPAIVVEFKGGAALVDAHTFQWKTLLKDGARYHVRGRIAWNFTTPGSSASYFSIQGEPAYRLTFNQANDEVLVDYEFTWPQSAPTPGSGLLGLVGQPGVVGFAWLRDFTIQEVGNPPVDIAPRYVIDEVGWSQSLESIINDLTVVYGPAPAGGGQRPVYNEKRAASVAKYGARQQTITTELEGADDAKLFAAEVLDRWSEPQWEAPQIIVRPDLMDDYGFDLMMKIDVSDVVTTPEVTDEPLASGGEGSWFVEGWRETFDRQGGAQAPLTHELQLAVASLARWTTRATASSHLVARVNAATLNFGTPLTITATLTSSVPVVGSIVQVWEGSRFIAFAAVDAAGVVVFNLGSRIPAGRHTYSLVHPGTQLMGTSRASVVATVRKVAAVSLKLAMSSASQVEGNDVLFTATLLPVGATGSIRWQYSDDDGGSWSTSDVVSPLDANGKASRKWVARGPNKKWKWRAVYRGSTSVGPITSAAVAIDVTPKPNRSS
jgi:hypothetical protein